MKKAFSFVLTLSLLLSAITLPVLAATPESGTLEVTWQNGYCVAAPHNGRSAYIGKDYTESAKFAATDVFTVPKAGTKLTWSDTGKFAAESILTVSSWKQQNGSWVLDTNGAMFLGASGSYNTCIETKKNTNGVVEYTYTTSKDNEHLRLCIQSENQDTLPTVSYTVTGDKGTWDTVQSLFPADPGAPVDGAVAVGDISWYNGYVGSATNTSNTNKISYGGVSYAFSSVITVPKAGTTIYFYDDLGTDANNKKHASSNAYGVSTWTESGSSWKIDLTGDNIAAPQLPTSSEVAGYKLYSFTTTRDNQSIRLCFLYGLSDASLPIRPATVWMKEADMDAPPITAGRITETAMLSSSGERVDFKIYLPSGYLNKNDKLWTRAVFTFGTDTALLAELSARKDLTVVQYAGKAEHAPALIQYLISNGKVNKYSLFAIGAKSYTDACSSLLVHSLESASGYADTDALLTALLEPNELPYHSILEGLTFYAMGDSYFNGSAIGTENTWVNRMGDRYGMTYENYGIGGSTMSAYVTNRNPMVNRYQNMAKGDADFILLEGGRNDRNVAAPLGDIDSRDPKTFYGAVNTMLDGMLETYPNALIILVTPWYTISPSSADGKAHNVMYADALRNLAEHRNNHRIVCLYAADKDATGVNMDDKSFRNTYTIDADTSHLNLKGMMMVQPYMEKFIADALTAFRASRQEHVHTYGDWVTVKEPTQTVPGMREKTCSCGHTVSERLLWQPPATEPGEEKPNHTGLIIGIAAGAAALIAAACVTVVFVKRKKSV